MTSEWDAQEQPPANVSLDDKVRWKLDHIAVFQRTRLDLPQTDLLRLKSSVRKKIMTEYELAVAKAKFGDPLPAEVEKAIRTNVLEIRNPSVAKK